MKLGLRIFGGLVVLLVVLVGAAFFMVKSVDLSSYQSLITKQVAKATGRTLTISGPLEVELALSPAISATDLKFDQCGLGLTTRYASYRTVRDPPGAHPLAVWRNENRICHARWG